MKSMELKTIGAPLWARIRKDIALLNERIDNIHQFTYVVADSLPTPSADTMYIIYFVPAPDQADEDAMEEWVTVADTSTTPTTYKWERVGNISDVLISITQDEFDEIFN